MANTTTSTHGSMDSADATIQHKGPGIKTWGILVQGDVDKTFPELEICSRTWQYFEHRYKFDASISCALAFCRSQVGSGMPSPSGAQRWQPGVLLPATTMRFCCRTSTGG